MNGGDWDTGALSSREHELWSFSLQTKALPLLAVCAEESVQTHPQVWEPWLSRDWMKPVTVWGRLRPVCGTGVAGVHDTTESTEGWVTYHHSGEEVQHSGVVIDSLEHLEHNKHYHSNTCRKYTENMVLLQHLYRNVTTHVPHTPIENTHNTQTTRLCRIPLQCKPMACLNAISWVPSQA